jgi:SAM-dependent methyltransferase
MNSVPGVEGERRLNPRLWDYNYYCMRRLADALTSEVDRLLPRDSRATVIDFGCGTRPYESLFVNRAAEYIGVDFPGNSQATVLIDEQGRVPLPDGQADVLLSIQVLEHVVDLATYLGECARLLKPGGRLLLSTHGMWTYHPYPTDVRRWTCWGLEHEISQHGFCVEKNIGCVGPLAYTTLLRLQLFRGAMYQMGSAFPLLAHLASCVCQPLMHVEDLITPTSVKAQNSALYLVSAQKISPLPH